MSRRRRRPSSNRVATQERPQEQRAARSPNIRPGATNYKTLTSQVQQPPMKSYTPLSDSVIQTMYQNMGPQANQDYMYAPGVPLRPVPGLTPGTGPRVMDYPVGVNIGQLPRSTEIYSFADLRALSTMYYGIQMCQQVWFDYISQLELDIQPIPSLIGEDGDTSMYEDDIQAYKDFFAYPDRDHDLHSWIQMAVKDQLEIDAVAIYPRKDRAGRLYSLDLIDATMFTPLVDDRGRKPLLPFPAFAQFVHGVPASLLTRDDLIYVKETERTDSVYGRSRTERVILNINVALRKQTKDLAHFTDGNLPPGFITPTMDVQWSQEEIEAWEMQLNNLLAGNDELRARLRVLPRGFEYKAVMDNDDIHMELDQFILNITAACHGLTMAELAFTGDVNRSTGDSQENVVYRRAMGPLMKRYARLFTMILQKYFGEKRFIVSFRGYEESEDLQANATAYTQLTSAGILGLTDAKKLLKLPEDPDEQYIGRVYMTQNGPIFLDDMANPAMRDAQNAAKLAGFDMASNPQLAAAGGAASPASPDESSAPPEGNSGENESPAVARLMRQVEGILARLNRAEEVRTQVGGPHTGIMVAFMLDEDVAEQLALPDGEPAEDLHVTLCLLGDVEDFTGNVANLCQVLANFAYSARPVEGVVSGIARFNPSEEDNVTPVVALVNVHHLHRLREDVVHALELVGYEIDHTFAYQPHITLDYIPADDPLPVNEVPELPLCFDTVWLCVGDERFPFHFGELPGERDDDEDEEEDDDHEQTERMITAMLQTDEVEPFTTLERDWAAFDAKRVPKGRKHAAAKPSAAEKRAQAALAREVKAQMKLMKIKASAAVKEARQEAKNTKAQARVKATIAKTAARTAAAKAKLAKQKAHIQAQAAAAKAKAARMAAAAQKKQAAANAKASRAQAATDKKQAAAEAKAAKAQAKAAKTLQALISTISNKAQIYHALSTRKTSKSWTTQDAQDAQAISNDLQQLTDHVNAHGNEGDATGLLNSLASSIDALRAQQGITQARASALDKLSVHIEQQLQRSTQNDDEDDIDDTITQQSTQEWQSGETARTEGTTDEKEKATRFTADELVRLTQSVAAQGNQVEADREIPGNAKGDYRRWRACACDDIKAGRSIRTFTSTLIPEHIHRQISTALVRCTTQDAVREVFRAAQSPDYHWQDSSAPIQQFLAGLKAKGVETITWHAYMGACPDCALNDGQTIPLNKRFASGAYIVPNHAHCVCQYTDNLGNRYEWTGTDGEYKQIMKGK